MEEQKIENQDFSDSKTQKRVQIPRFVFKKKKCKLCKLKIDYPDYKDADFLSKFITEKGKILPRRINGCCEKHQRRIKTVVKRARYMAILPFVKNEITNK